MRTYARSLHHAGRRSSLQFFPEEGIRDSLRQRGTTMTTHSEAGLLSATAETALERWYLPQEPPTAAHKGPLHDQAADHIGRDKPLRYLEFGVHEGWSIRRIASIFSTRRRPSRALIVSSDCRSNGDKCNPDTSLPRDASLRLKFARWVCNRMVPEQCTGGLPWASS